MKDSRKVERGSGGIHMGLLCRYKVCSGQDAGSRCPCSGRDAGCHRVLPQDRMRALTVLARDGMQAVTQSPHSRQDGGSHSVSVLFPQVPRVKLDKLCAYLVPPEHKDFRGPRVSKDPKVHLVS